MDRFTLSGFGDEISADPDEQLAVLASVGIRELDLRGARERNVLDFSDDDARALRAALASHHARVAMIASPIGKSDITRDAAFELGRIEVALRMADAFETRLIRVFSFYHAGIPHAECRDEALRRLHALAERAERADITLLLENEVDLWGDTPERMRDLLVTVDSPRLRLTFDTGNFASLGVGSRDEAYPILRPFLSHVQIKDVRTGAGTTLPGEGDGQISELLADLVRDDYRGYLSLEPHLALAGKAGGFSGPHLFAEAARALQRLVSAATTVA